MIRASVLAIQRWFLIGTYLDMLRDERVEPDGPDGDDGLHTASPA